MFTKNLLIGLMAFIATCCSKDLFQKNESDNEKIAAVLSDGLCIYPINQVSVKDPKDTASRIVEQLGEVPYIAYNEIVSYDTVFNILQLTITTQELKKRISQDNLNFAVTLNGEILYRGSFRYNTMSSTYNKPCIIVGDELDTLQNNQIRICNGYPKWYKKYYYDDDRYQPGLIQQLKKDNKATGKLFETTTQNTIIPGNEGVEFFYIKGIKGSSDMPTAKTINGIKMSDLILEPEPFIKYANIAYYDTVNHLFLLREPITLIPQPKITDLSKFYAITVNRKPIFAGGFYAAHFSAPCQYIYIMLGYSLKNPATWHILNLEPSFTGYPYSTPLKINYPEMVNKLKADRKIRNNFVL